MPNQIVAPGRLRKHPDESLGMRVDFTAQLVAGEELSSVVSVTAIPETITIDPAELDGTDAVSLRISDGIQDEDYKITVTVETNLGHTKVVPGILEVREAAMATQVQTATQLHFQSQPSSSQAGVNIGTVRVTVLNAANKVVATNTSLITVTLSGGVFSTGGNVAVVQAVKGIATFTGLSLTEAGSYSLLATSAGLSSATSSSFNITPAVANHLSIEQSPLSADVGQLLSPNLIVEVRDAFNNIVTSNTSTVTVSVASGPGAFTGSTTSVAAVAGVATFSNLKLNTEGAYTLTVVDGDASDGILTGAATGNVLVGDVDEPETVSGQLTQGWATFGQVLPQGQAYGALQVGALATQTDIKNVWDDGSIKYAVVTAYVPTTGTYAIGEASANPGTFTTTLPTASVKFTINGTLYTAAVPTTHSSEKWLDGPNVIEERHKVTPKDSQNNLQPFLTVIFDVRMYSDGKTRLDVCVENCLHKAGAALVTYDVVVDNGATVLFSKTAVNHYWLTRWRKTFNLGSWAPSQITPDFTPYYEADAFPEFADTVTATTLAATSVNYNILGVGFLNPDMGAVGGRMEIAIVPDPVARYLVHKTQAMRDFALVTGDLGASWPKALYETNGSLFTIDAHPGFWLDSRGDVGNKPLSTINSPLHTEINHLPTLAYVPYLITGDRFYADEMMHWANWCLLWTYQNVSQNGRGGSQGLLKSNQVRGNGWGLKCLVEAASYLPDAYASKAYIAQKVQNNLTYYDTWAGQQGSPLGASWDDKRPENGTNPDHIWIALWEHNYLSWAIWWAQRQGFTGGSALLNRQALYQTNLMTSGAAFDRRYCAALRSFTGTRTGTAPNYVKHYYTTLPELFTANFVNAQTLVTIPPPQLQGLYGADARLMLLYGIEQGWAGTQDAYNWLNPQLATTIYTNNASDLNWRAGWHVKPRA